MTRADLPWVLALAGLLHPEHPESAAVFAERLALAPGFCRVLPGGAGYAIAHPWASPEDGAAPPPLDSLLGRLPLAPNALHLHDIALHPMARGAGRAAAVVAALLEVAAAQGLREASLIAVAGKAGYWAGLGFRPAGWPPSPALASYGAGALAMVRPLVSRSAS
ncbi:MAG: family N-acetyltransferase [Belnapia sp.]|nr:family N-acetyltransferase [Belnapia sp.]